MLVMTGTLAVRLESGQQTAGARMTRSLVSAAIRALLVVAFAGHGAGYAFTARSSHRNLPPSSDGLSASTIWTSSSLAKPRSPSSLATQAGSPLLDNGSCVEPCSPLYQGKHVGRTRTRGRDATLRRQASRGGSAATGELAKVSGPSFLGRKPKVTVRQAKERDYQGVAEIRGVIIPVGMSGATGFLGGKVVIDDPAEAERRLLMAKVADLVSGEAVALIALEGKRIVGTVDCIVQPVGAAMDTPRQQRQQSGKLAPGGEATTQVFLKNLFVLPDARRRGVARELVKGAEVFARKEKAGMICLDVARKNTAARELYHSCGFKDMERPGPVEGGIGGALLKSFGMGKRYMVKSI